jgi:hypothetical protein
LGVSLSVTSHAAQEKRVALVIGNGAYQHAAPLPNPVNDASDLAGALRELGFDVIEGQDLTLTALGQRVREFARRAGGARVALFFYAGHGMQVGDRNYLVPIDARLEHPSDLDFETVEVDKILQQMQAEDRVNLVFLDACRDNPLARSLARSLTGTRSATVEQGLAKIDAGRGTLIAFATSPKKVALDGGGRNSPFTAALLKHIRTPGMDIQRVLTRVTGDVEDSTNGTQSPWVHASLRYDVVLKPAEQAPSGPSIAVPQRPTAPDPCRDAAAHYRGAESLGTESAFEDHLKQFPACPFASLARGKLAALKEKAAAEKAEQERQRVAATGAECDRLAANPYDPRRPADIAGVPYGELQVHAREAIAACEKALKSNPNEPRYLYQLARASQSSDPKKAFGLYRRATQQSYPAAFDNLGWMYLTGRGGTKSEGEAVRAFSRGADLGDPDAMVSLAKLYAAGTGVAQSAERAQTLYQRAAVLGHQDAVAMVQKLEDEAVRAAEARRNSEEAAKMFLNILGGIATPR